MLIPYEYLNPETSMIIVDTIGIPTPAERESMLISDSDNDGEDYDMSINEEGKLDN